MAKATPLCRAPPLKLSAVVTALLMVACAHSARVAPVASGDLLLFNDATQALEVSGDLLRGGTFAARTCQHRNGLMPSLLAPAVHLMPGGGFPAESSPSARSATTKPHINHKP